MTCTGTHNTLNFSTCHLLGTHKALAIHSLPLLTIFLIFFHLDFLLVHSEVGPCFDMQITVFDNYAVFHKGSLLRSDEMIYKQNL